jgi:hypothetical protein
VGTLIRPLETGWLDDTPVEDNLIRRFVRNQADLDALHATAGGGRAAEAPGVALADAGADLAYTNQSTLQRPLATVDDPALDALDDFWSADRGRPHTLLSVWPTPDLAVRGWHLAGHPMLVVRAPGPHAPAERPGVSIEMVRTPEALALAEQTMIEGYPVPGPPDRPVGSLLPPSLLDTDMVFRLGRVDGEVAAATRGYVAHGVVNLCMAATLPAARRRGVWAAMVWARVDDGADLPAVAYTSDDSRPGFVRMGFLPITRCTLWMRA